MEGCIAPSEVPGVSPVERTNFGKIAEDLIYMDFCRQKFYSPGEVYVDDNNTAAYLYFLKMHNPQLGLTSFAMSLESSSLGMKRPDLLVHSLYEQAFYEIKPNSITGKQAGIQKLGILSATYVYFKLPYTLGLTYKDTEIVVASVAGQITVKLKAALKGPGLILYQLCLESSSVIDSIILAAILRYIIKKMNEQAGKGSFKPIDLKPAFAREGQLSALANTLGLVMVTGAAYVGWKYFWKAVAKRFAARGAAAALLAAADGPLPIGDLIAVGLAVWTIVDIIRLSDTLWTEAGRLANQQA
jgi:hypothetical protein